MEKSFINLLSSIEIDTPKLELSDAQWQYCFEQAQKHAIVGALFSIVKDKLAKDSSKKNKLLFFEWLGVTYQAVEANKVLNERSAILSRIFRSWGYESCVLKGQGVAQLYPDPSLRQSGDIDIWVNGNQDEIIKCLRANYIGITNIDYVHSGITIFGDVKVEVHFRPSWMYNPFTNRKLQQFFCEQKEEQFGNYYEKLGFAYPTISFNLVYSLIHINRHIFEEGIGLRQLLDYYYILKHSSKNERVKAQAVLHSIHLTKFAGAIMYVLKNVFGLNDDYLLCLPEIKEGEFLMEEIMRGGNFGKYDERNRWLPANKLFLRGWYNLKRNKRYLIHYPSEVLWIPIWKTWHWIWRKRKGYL